MTYFVIRAIEAATWRWKQAEDARNVPAVLTNTSPLLTS